MESFNQMKEGCETIAGLESLLDAEARAEVTQERLALEQTIVNSMTMLTDLQHVEESLKVSGFSDDWFDMINQDGKFMQFVHMDVSKFNGKLADKEKACMEGIADTIREWLKAAWEAIKKFFAFIRDCIHKVWEWMGGNISADSDIARSLKDGIEKVEEETLRKEGVLIKDFFDLRSLERMINIVSLISMFISTEDFIEDELTMDERNIKALVVRKLTARLQDERIPTNKVAEVGISIEHGEIIYFSGRHTQDFKKNDIRCNSKAELMNIYNKMFTDIVMCRNAARSTIVSVQKDLKNRIDVCEKQYHRENITGHVVKSGPLLTEMGVILKIVNNLLKVLVTTETMSRRMSIAIYNLLVTKKWAKNVKTPKEMNAAVPVV